MKNWFRSRRPQASDTVVDLEDKRFLKHCFEALEKNNFDVSMLSDRELERLYQHCVVDQPPSARRAIINQVHSSEAHYRRQEKLAKFQRINVAICCVLVVIQIALVFLR